MPHYRPHIYLFVVNLLYGAGYSVSKLVMPQYIPPFGFILIRVLATSFLFTLLHRFWVKEKVEAKDLPLLAACGLFGVVINQEMFFLGLSITTPINASLIMIMTPILVFVVSFLLAHEEATWQKVVGLLLGVAGAIFILGGRNFSFSGKSILGDLFILINAASYGVYLVIVRPLMAKYHPLTVIKWVFLFGLAPVVLIGYGQFLSIGWHAFTTTTWLALVFVVVGTTFLAYLLNVLALREVQSSVVGAYIYMQPVLATLISIAIGQDRLDWEKVIAATLIFGGVYLVSFARAGKKQVYPGSDTVLME